MASPARSSPDDGSLELGSEATIPALVREVRASIERQLERFDRAKQALLAFRERERQLQAAAALKWDRQVSAAERQRDKNTAVAVAAEQKEAAAQRDVEALRDLVAEAE